ncbi:unnamed protein product, partial [Iphiclides podalirius]
MNWYTIEIRKSEKLLTRWFVDQRFIPVPTGNVVICDRRPRARPDRSLHGWRALCERNPDCIPPSERAPPVTYVRSAPVKLTRRLFTTYRGDKVCTHFPYRPGTTPGECQMLRVPRPGEKDYQAASLLLTAAMR